VGKSRLFTLSDIETAAEHLLSLEPDPIPRLRIQRDILRVSRSSKAFSESKASMKNCRWVLQLAEEQHQDGSWGRFHTEDTKSRQRIPTTQHAILRGIELGLEKDDAIFSRAAAYMVDVLEDRRRWHDTYEKNPWFEPAVKLFTAASLAMVDSEHSSLPIVWKPWFDVFRETFERGGYDIAKERSASLAILGVDISGSYIGFGSAPILELFGARSRLIPASMQRGLIEAVWNGSLEMYYLRRLPKSSPVSIQDYDFFRWLRTMDIISCFPVWKEVAHHAAKWLWDQRGSDGIWDCGSRPGKTASIPLSESWRFRRNRAIDTSVLVLSLLRRCVE
jgi:hypothetical protein